MTRRRITLADSLEHRAARFAGQPPGEERNGDSHRLEPAPETLRVLIGEQLGGRHQRDLPSAFDGGGRRERCDQRLAATHVPLHQPQHRLVELEVRLDLAEHAPLRARRC